MKYNSKTKVLEFASDEGVFRFHDQLTELMRFAMSNIGSDDTGDAEALALTQDFFQQYSALTETLNSLRAHLPRAQPD